MRAAGVPARVEHEVIHDELTSVLEQIGKRLLTFWTDEDVFLLDFRPWQLAPLPRQVIFETGELFFFRQQRDARIDPLVVREHRMIFWICHGDTATSSRASVPIARASDRDLRQR